MAKDKVENLKNNGWKQSFSVVDTNGKKLGGKDYIAKNATYTVIEVPEGAEESLKGTELVANPNTPVPAGSTIEIRVPLQGTNYEGVVKGTYRILAKDHDISKATFKIANKDYTGSEVELTAEDITTAEIKINKVVTKLELDTDYEIVGYEKNINKGTAKVTFKGKGEFGGEKTVTFEINQRDADKNWWENLVEAILN